MNGLVYNYIAKFSDFKNQNVKVMTNVQEIFSWEIQ